MFELKQKETSRAGSMNLGALGKSFKQSLLLYLCGPILPCIPTVREEGSGPISRVREDEYPRTSS